jgi:hypothetical protein
VVEAVSAMKIKQRGSIWEGGNEGVAVLEKVTREGLIDR